MHSPFKPPTSKYIYFLLFFCSFRVNCTVLSTVLSRPKLFYSRLQGVSLLVKTVTEKQLLFSLQVLFQPQSNMNHRLGNSRCFHSFDFVIARCVLLRDKIRRRYHTSHCIDWLERTPSQGLPSFGDWTSRLICLLCSAVAVVPLDAVHWPPVYWQLF